MIRLPPTRICLGQEDVDAHLQNIFYRHALAAGMHQFSFGDGNPNYEDDTGCFDSDASSTRFFSSPEIPDSEDSGPEFDPSFLTPKPKASQFTRYRQNNDTFPSSLGSSARSHSPDMTQIEELTPRPSRSHASMLETASIESSEQMYSADTALYLMSSGYRGSSESQAEQRVGPQVNSLAVGGRRYSPEIPINSGHMTLVNTSGRERVRRVGRVFNSFIVHPVFIQTILPSSIHNDLVIRSCLPNLSSSHGFNQGLDFLTSFEKSSIENDKFNQPALEPSEKRRTSPSHQRSQSAIIPEDKLKAASMATSTEEVRDRPFGSMEEHTSVERSEQGVPQDSGLPNDADLFHQRFEEMLAHLDDEQDEIEEWGLRELRRLPLGDWYHKQV